MINNLEALAAKKYMLVKNILDKSSNKSFFDKLDTLILKKCFDNAYEYSLAESIERINNCNLSSRDITEIINNFTCSVENNLIFNNRSLYEMVKLSILPSKKLNKTISIDNYLKIATYLHYVSHETKFIRFDFLVLRITDNFLVRIDDIKNDKLTQKYLNLKKSILEKMVIFSYSKENKNKETTFLCWIDRLLLAAVEQEIDIKSFINISKKILCLTDDSIYVLWKLVNSINYLLSIQEIDFENKLRNYKLELEKHIENRYSCSKVSDIDLENILINTLAKQTIAREDFYYLFDALIMASKTSEKNKLFSLQLCNYLLYYDHKKHLFSYRYIRKHFADNLFSMFSKNDIIEIKLKELQLLICLWFNDVFFCFEKKRVLFSIINILKSINTSEVKLNHNNFYKYCDILDYMIANDNDSSIPDIVDFLATNNQNKHQIAKHFKLIKSRKLF